MKDAIKKPWNEAARQLSTIDTPSTRTVFATIAMAQLEKQASSTNVVDKPEQVATAETKTEAKAQLIASIKKKSKKSKKNARKVKTEYEPPKELAGILATEQLQEAMDRARERVATISRLCRARNEKFKDSEFDFSSDKDACLHGLGLDESARYDTSGVMRVTEIFDNPVLFKDGANASDIAQGVVGDCWFLSALGAIAAIPGLIEKICVAHDVQVGVYAFIFFRDGLWQEVIIDDQLFVSTASYDELSFEEAKVYHFDRDLYNSIARKGRKILCFGRGLTDDEVWVPLIEKAYAKFYGSYAAISGGWTMEGIEDLTGGVSYAREMHDVLDLDALWNELVEHTSRENKSKTYACGSNRPENAGGVKQENLIYNHAYAVLKAAEYNGKRFVVIRNPWGNNEWKGRWSDGSKEWTKEWLPALDVLDHKFGDDGQFVQEWSDFLTHWQSIDGARLFDSSWKVSSVWVELTGMTALHAGKWGDVSFTISVPQATPAVIVLQKVDTRSFKDIAGHLLYDFDFVIFKKGQKEIYATSFRKGKWRRSQSTEVDFEAGDYIVHVRLDALAYKEADYLEQLLPQMNERILAQTVARRKAAYSLALNYSDQNADNSIPVTLDNLAGYDLTEIELKWMEEKREADAKLKAEKKAALEANGATDETATTAGDEKEEKEGESEENKAEAEPTTDPAAHDGTTCKMCSTSPINGALYTCNDESCQDYTLCTACFEKKEHNQAHSMTVRTTPTKIIHVGEQCSSCSKEPIIGTLYRCMKSDCDTNALCSVCYDKKEHSAKHPILVQPFPEEAEEEETQEEEEEVPVHENFTCDMCGTSPIVGPRFHCIDVSCPDFDLCEKCNARGVHSPTHHMMRLNSPEEATYLNASSSDGSELVLGLRVYTKAFAPATLAAQLKHVMLTA